jgi:hypothetical protein
MADLFEGTYCVERWWDDDRGVEQTLAACSNLHIARAAYAKAVRRFPDKLIYLRQRAFVMERHAPETSDDSEP